MDEWVHYWMGSNSDEMKYVYISKGKIEYLTINDDEEWNVEMLYS